MTAEPVTTAVLAGYRVGYEDGRRDAVTAVTRRLLDEAAVALLTPGWAPPFGDPAPGAVLQHAATLALASAHVDTPPNSVYDGGCSGERPAQALRRHRP